MKVPDALHAPAAEKKDAVQGQDHAAQEKKSDEKAEREIGLEELSKHNTEQDLWVAVEGGVYNCTYFNLFAYCISSVPCCCLLTTLLQ